MSKEEREKARITLHENPSFPITTDGAIMSSQTLAGYVNELFSRVFADYLGCKIFVDIQDQIHPVQLQLFFAVGDIDPENTDKLIAFRLIKGANTAYTEQNKMNYSALMSNYNATVTSNRSSEITEDAIDIISSMVYYDTAMKLGKNPTNKDFINQGITIENCTVNGGTPYITPNTQKILTDTVQKVDINSILSILFEKSDEEEKAIYKTTPIKPIIPMNMPPQTISDAKWLFIVNRIHKTNFMDVCNNELGSFNPTGNLNIYRNTLSK